MADILGTPGDDTLTGTTDDDVIDGLEGADQMDGGEGSDLYYVDNAGDVVADTGLSGIDTIRTTVNYTIPVGVERLAFVGTGSWAGNGNALANILYGGGSDDIISGAGGDDILLGLAGNDSLIGGQGEDYLIGGIGDDTLSGGAGLDSLQGGVGDDIYIVNDYGDSIIEFAGEGIDEVRTSNSIYAILGEIENLTLTDGGVHLAAVGNTLANVITGGSGRDDLFGREGDDTLIGGTGAANTVLGGEGNDTYIVQVRGDSVIEFDGEGIDTVQTGLFAYELRHNVENLTYTGTGDFIGIGNDNDNVITSGNGEDFLSGHEGDDILTGGSGADTLIGGSGADQFRYQGLEVGLDRVLDFESGVDKIVLLESGFFHTSTIEFVSGTMALTTNSTFVYDPETGIVTFDADGTGEGSSEMITQLDAGLTLTLGDFMFV
jgi:serralysin